MNYVSVYNKRTVSTGQTEHEFKLIKVEQILVEDKKLEINDPEVNRLNTAIENLSLSQSQTSTTLCAIDDNSTPQIQHVQPQPSHIDRLHAQQALEGIFIITGTDSDATTLLSLDVTLKHSTNKVVLKIISD